MAIRSAPPTRDDYLAKIISQHRNKPKFTATVENVVGPAADAATVISKLPADFDLDLAIGVQLDVVGEWVGVSRNIQVPLVPVWFSFGIEGRGWGEGIWKGKYDPETGVAKLDDDTYRDLIRFKIRVNTWDGLTGSAYDAVSVFYAGTDSHPFIDDGCDMQMAVCISGARPSLMRFAIFAERRVEFRPAGVKTRAVVPSVANGPVFGFGAYNEFIGGFGTGSWAVDAIDALTMGGVVYERVMIDGAFVEIDGYLVYMEI